MRDVGLSIVSLVFVLAFIEVGLRLVDPDHSALRPHVPRVQMKDYYVPDSEMGIDIRPNSQGIHTFTDLSYPVFSNRYGCFDWDDVPKDYILLVGDSVAWGFAPFETKWAVVTERILGKRILKCGVKGTGTRHQLLKAKSVIESVGHSPSLIILGYTGNDIQDDFAFPSDTVELGYRVRATKKIDLETGEIERYSSDELRELIKKARSEESGFLYLRQHSTIVNLVWRAFRRFLGRGRGVPDHRYRVPLWDIDKPWAAEARQRHLDALEEFKDLADEYNSDLFLVVSASSEIVPHLSGFSYFDVSKAMGPGFSWKRDSHWNEEGNRVAGELIAAQLTRGT